MAWTRVQGGGNQGSNAPTTAKSITISPIASGNSVLGLVAWDAAGNVALSSVTDDKGNSYNLETTRTDTNNGGLICAYSRSNITNAPSTFTATFASAIGYTGIIADEFSGGTTAATDGRDGTAHGGRFQAAAGTGTDAVNSGTFTTATNGDLIYGAVMVGNGITNPAIGTGFTTATSTNSADFAMRTEWRSQTTAAAGTMASFTQAANNDNTTFMIAIKPAGAGGGTAYTLTAVTGTFTLNGQAAALRRARLPLAAVTGSFALSGKAAGLAFGHKFAAVTGSFTLVGNATGLAFGHRLVAAPGAVALAGQPAILRYSGSAAILTALPGAFVLSDVAAKLAYARKFVTVTGTFVLSGQAATLSYARVMPAVKATFTLNGVAASLRTGRNTVTVPGAFVLNGQPVNFRYTRVFPATAGAFNLASAPANLIWSGSGSKLLPAMRGQFVLSGKAAGSRLTRVMAALPGSFVLAGQAAGLRKDRILSAAKGVFALLGNPANMIYVTAHDRVMPAQRGSFLLTGVNANLIANQLEKQPGPIEFGRPVWLRAW